MPVDIHDPFGGGAGGAHQRRRRAFLIGKKPKAKKVQFLYKLALYKGQSVSIYGLLNGKHRHISKPDQALIDRVLQDGHEIDHPAIPYEDVPAWIAHAKRETKRLGLSVEEEDEEQDSDVEDDSPQA